MFEDEMDNTGAAAPMDDTAEETKTEEAAPEETAAV